MYRKLIILLVIIFALSGCGQGGVNRTPGFNGKIYFESNRFPGKSYLENTGTSYYTGKKVVDLHKDWWNPQISKDGMKLVFRNFVKEEKKIGKFFILDVNTGEKKEKNISIGVLKYVWMPDNSKIGLLAWEKTKNGENLWNVFIYDPTTNDLKKLTDNIIPKIFVKQYSFSPDGKRMVYGIPKTGAFESYLAVRIIDVDTKEVKELPFASGNMAWSPDGKTIVLSGTYYEEDGKMNLGSRIIFYDVGSDEYRIMEKPGGKNAFQYIEEPCYSPDGSKVAFIRVENSGAKTLWMMDADGSNWQQLLSGVGHIDSISWGE